MTTASFESQIIDITDKWTSQISIKEYTLNIQERKTAVLTKWMN